MMVRKEGSSCAVSQKRRTGVFSETSEGLRRCSWETCGSVNGVLSSIPGRSEVLCVPGNVQTEAKSARGSC